MEHAGWLVRDAIARQIASDVPVCSFLSGGLDFSIITAVALQFMGGRGWALNTFLSILCGNDQFFRSNMFQPARDRPFADIMTARFPVRHTPLEYDTLTLADIPGDAVRAKDLPGMTDV